ncbi:heavy-metal-associated domain-containing protein [Silvibacterium acidisoli]|uniref:heavy-metal-associated domain-containing protein n=1 Tax=Acidobacteriaceae bacterium ZG23-2 TaxID=2883246 RepID=UPI00406BFDCC
MERRRFMQLAGLAGVSTIAAANALESKDAKTIAYSVKGFTCITCAVGLETLLRQEKGVLKAEASYPGASVVIHYDSAKVNPDQLKGYIAEMGFTATEKHA